MRKPTHTALRWGPPVALAAAAIAALFVVPVFGRGGTSLKDRINATRLYTNGATVKPTSGRVGSLALKPGDYVVTSTYQVYRRVDHDVTCDLELRDNAGVQDQQNAEMFGPVPHTGNDQFVYEPGSLSATAHVGEHARARMFCAGNGTVAPGAQITALRVPKVTQKAHLN
jgi:hypothetical protein